MPDKRAPNPAALHNSQEWYKPYITCYGSEKPSLFAETLAKKLPIEAGATRLLDIGCGSGIIGIYSLIKKKAASVTFNDLYSEWIDITRCNVDIKVRQGKILPSQVSYANPDAFSKIPVGVIGQQNLLVFNPPQLPKKYADEETLRKIESDPIESGFRLSGPDGLRIARQFFKWYARLKAPKPDAIIILSSFLGRRLIEKTIASFGLQSQGPSPIEERVDLRPMFQKYADQLSSSPDELKDRSLVRRRGSWTKNLLVYRLNNRK